MKKSTIIGLLTFTFLLFGSLSAYASWGMSYGSDIYSATVTIYGYSYTGTTVLLMMSMQKVTFMKVVYTA